MFHKTLVIIQIMKVSPAQLSPLLRTDTQGFILAQLFMNPEDGFSISELARFAGVSTPTAMREVDRLVESHMVTERTFGRARLIQVNTKHLLYEPTRQIVVNSWPRCSSPRRTLWRRRSREGLHLWRLGSQVKA
jgi:AraC-like DNA-binding protein